MNTCPGCGNPIDTMAHEAHCVFRKQTHLCGDEDEDKTVTCRRCGATGLEWINTGVRYRLMDDTGKFHQCQTKAPASDFEVET